MTRLGDAIRTARLAANMTQKQLGKKAGLTEKVISEIESGRRIASDNQARLILKILGADAPVSTELEAAAEKDVALRPKPRPYVMPLPENKPETATEPVDAWRDALTSVVKRVPVVADDGVVIDHELVAIVSGKIEGGAPDKVFYYRCPDDSLRGWRVHAGDMLLTVPESMIIDEAIMVVQYKGRRLARKVKKLDGNRILLQSFDRELEMVKADRADVMMLGLCVKLLRKF
ncbi:MAG: helix-turn-helix domain-containing protein [Clostridia bacterium]|nr:helix-turn-helix domain-containing protein [Clostridia bacterium]